MILKILIAVILLTFPITCSSEARWPSSDIDCLAANIYHEARGEPTIGQHMVAQVTINRLRSSKYPDTICEVVKQPYQFSWTHLIKDYRPRDEKAWLKSVRIATWFLHQTMFYDISDGAMYYHAAHIKPSWSDGKVLIVKIANHIFYK